MLEECLKELIKEYIDHHDITQKPKNPNEVKKIISKWTFRHGVSLALQSLSGNNDLSQQQVIKLFDFLMKHGLAELNENVYKQNLNTGRILIKKHALQHSELLFSKVDAGLQKLKKRQQNAQADYIREGMYVCF